MSRHSGFSIPVQAAPAGPVLIRVHSWSVTPANELPQATAVALERPLPVTCSRVLVAELPKRANSVRCRFVYAIGKRKSHGCILRSVINASLHQLSLSDHK